MSRIIIVYQLPEEEKDQQYWIDRADEDLLCALYLLRHQPCDYLPTNNICYLLHQSLEKWLKLYLTFLGDFCPGHNLDELFKRVLAIDPAFIQIYVGLFSFRELVLAEKASSRMYRYGNGDGLEDVLAPLLRAALRTRRLVKITLKAEVQ